MNHKHTLALLQRAMLYTSSAACRSIPYASVPHLARSFSDVGGDDSHLRRNLVPTKQQQQPVAQKDDWTEVVHKETGQLYYWNEKTGETTALGEPKPGPYGRQPYPQQQRAPSVGGQLVGLVAAGAGIGLVFAILKHVL